MANDAIYSESGFTSDDSNAPKRVKKSKDSKPQKPAADYTAAIAAMANGGFYAKSDPISDDSITSQHTKHFKSSRAPKAAVDYGTAGIKSSPREFVGHETVPTLPVDHVPASSPTQAPTNGFVTQPTQILGTPKVNQKLASSAVTGVPESPVAGISSSPPPLPQPLVDTTTDTLQSSIGLAIAPPGTTFRNPNGVKPTKQPKLSKYFSSTPVMDSQADPVLEHSSDSEQDKGKSNIPPSVFTTGSRPAQNSATTNGSVHHSGIGQDSFDFKLNTQSNGGTSQSSSGSFSQLTQSFMYSPSEKTNAPEKNVRVKPKKKVRTLEDIYDPEIRDAVRREKTNHPELSVPVIYKSLMTYGAKDQALGEKLEDGVLRQKLRRHQNTFPHVQVDVIYQLLNKYGGDSKMVSKKLSRDYPSPTSQGSTTSAAIDLTQSDQEDEIATAQAHVAPRATSAPRKLSQPRKPASPISPNSPNVNKGTTKGKNKRPARAAFDRDLDDDTKLDEEDCELIGEAKGRRLVRGTRPRKQVKYEESDASDDAESLASSNKREPISQPANPVAPQATATKPAAINPETTKPKRKRADDWGSDTEDDFQVKKSRTTVETNGRQHSDFGKRLLHVLNHGSAEEIADISCQPLDVVKGFIQRRPFHLLDAARAVQLDADPKSRKKPQGSKLVNIAEEMLSGLEAVDAVVETCEVMSRPIVQEVSSWGYNIYGPNATQGRLGLSKLPDESSSDSDSTGSKRKRSGTANSSRFIKPSNNMAIDLTDYQKVGLNWLNLLWEKRLGCILADDMGLGKTCQVLAFLMHLKESGVKGPHIVIGPSSVTPNWEREVTKFCGDHLKARILHSSKAERVQMQVSFENEIDNGQLDLIITTYDQATNNRQWIKAMKPNVAIFDEAHELRNARSKRYKELMKLEPKHRIMLTGTPLQNNLQELISMLAFIMPDVFNEHTDELNYVFKHKAKTTDRDHDQLLSKQRILKARSMITPFCLRRKKDQCLSDFVPKTNRVIHCELTATQDRLYQLARQQFETAREEKKAGKQGVKQANLMSQLRKIAIHPMLERDHYTPEMVNKMVHAYLKVHPHDDFETIYELTQWVGDRPTNDFEYLMMSEEHPWLEKWRRPKSLIWEQSGKVQALLDLLKQYQKNGDRALVFSQFTTVLDILEPTLKEHGIKSLRIDGQVDMFGRQELIDQFMTDDSITTFFISTRSGGTGINLTAANKVVIFDQSFNPHDDIQAENRAHRVGQTREVEVIRLVTKGTVEENIYKLGQTKIELDQLVVGEGQNRENEMDSADDSMAEEVVNLMDEEKANGDLKNAFATGLQKAGVKLA